MQFRAQSCRNCSSPHERMSCHSVSMVIMQRRDKRFLSQSRCSVLCLVVCPQNGASNPSNKTDKLILLRKCFYICLQLIEYLNTLQCKAGSVINPKKTELYPQSQRAESCLAFQMSYTKSCNDTKENNLALRAFTLAELFYSASVNTAIC